MGTIVKKLNIRRDPNRIYFCAGNPIRVMSQGRRGQRGGRKVEADTGARREAGKLYYLSKEGDLEASPMKRR